MAARLEAATKQYGVPLLLSGDFAACLSPAVRGRVRQVDRVTVKGSTVPVALFAYDLDLERAGDVAAAMVAAAAAAGGAAGGGRSGGGSGAGDGAGASEAAQPDAGAGEVRARRAGGGGGGRGGVAAGGGDAADAILAPPRPAAGTGVGGSGGDDDDDWAGNPLVTDTWGLDAGFKAAWDAAMEVMMAKIKGFVRGSTPLAARPRRPAAPRRGKSWRGAPPPLPPPNPSTPQTQHTTGLPRRPLGRGARRL